MADAIVSAVAEQLISTITTQIQNEIHLVRGVDKELLDLSDKLKNIRNVLDDADRKQFKEKTVKNWLWRLEQTSYEMEDVLDEWNYAILQHKIQSQSQSATSSNRKVRSLIPCSCFSFKKLMVRDDIANKIQNLKSRLDLILNEKDVYNFVISHPQNDPSPASWRVQSTSLIDLEEVQGRNHDRDILVSKLCANGGDHERNRVLSIVGAGGLGKTTLAQLLYNDSQVKECFDLRIWICVSDPFDVAAIAKEIMEQIKEGSSPDTNQLHALLQGLIRSISGKRILLVLDDVWTEEYVKWEPLQNALKCGGAGSKILVTTRKVNVAKIMGTVDEDIHNLEILSQEDCWLLLRRLALLGRSEKEFEKFEEVGKGIAKKCNGFPLAAKTLGSLLRLKNRVEEWETVLKSEMWGLKQVQVDLFPHLLLSYQELSPMLKCCFSYCALFRKDERIKVETLIRLWMASGYLGSNIGSAGDEMELKGREYFEDLAMRSLFQDFERDDETDLIVACKMHDIVHDFAQFMRKNDREEASGVTDTGCKVCDPFIVSRVKEYRSVFWGKETLLNHCEYCLKSLRVLKIEWGVNGNLSGIKALIHLRWLNVSGKRLLKEEVKTICELYFLQTLDLDECDLKEIPSEIGNLVRLRHLNLSWNEKLKELPESIGNLVELQTLLLERCSLTEIPKEIGNLVRLRHLDLRWNKELKELPESIGNLVELRHLSLYENYELKELPESMCNLVELQTLHVDERALPKGIGGLSELRELIGWFRVGSGDNKLGMLKKLNHLTGSLDLKIKVCSGRDLEELVEDAGEAELKNKIHLQTLRIWFARDESESVSSSLSMDESESVSSSLWVDVIEALEPSHKLKELEIHGYEGSRLPHWISSPLNLLTSIRLQRLTEVRSLPALGKLPFLVDLYMYELKELKVVGGEWLGINMTPSSSTTAAVVVAFPKLKKLTFLLCEKWEEWEDITAEEEESAALRLMPSLVELRLRDCGRLKMLPHRLLRKAESLQLLNVYDSSELIKRYEDKDGEAWRSISQTHPQLRIQTTW